MNPAQSNGERTVGLSQPVTTDAVIDEPSKDSKMEDQPNISAEPAASTAKQAPTETNDTTRSSNLTPVSPNDPYDRKLDTDDSWQPRLTNQDASDKGWYNSPIDSNFFSADKD